jgi:hypothetical protein
MKGDDTTSDSIPQAMVIKGNLNPEHFEEAIDN